MIREVKINYQNQQTGEEVETEIKVAPARIFQYKGLAKTIGGITRKLKTDPELMEALQFQLFGAVDDSWKDKETGELLDEVKLRIGSNSIGLIGFALENLPDELILLVATLSNQNVAVIEGMDDESFFKVAEAIVEVNDLGKLRSYFEKFSEAIREKNNREVAKKESQNFIRETNQ